MNYIKLRDFIIESDDDNLQIGYLDADDNVRIPPIYYLKVIMPDGRIIFNHDGEFRNGMAVVMNRYGKFGIIDSDGKIVISLEYDSISNVIVNNIVFFRKASSCGFMKTNGTVVAEYHECIFLHSISDHIYYIEYENGRKNTKLDLASIK